MARRLPARPAPPSRPLQHASRKPGNHGFGLTAAYGLDPEASSSRVHGFEELAVAFGIAQLVEQEVDGVHGAHRVEDAAQDVHLLELLRLGEQLLLAGAGARDVDRWERALVGDLTVENDFRIAGALELFEDHLVHAAASVDEGRRDDGERSAFLDVARRAEEALGPLQR